MASLTAPAFRFLMRSQGKAVWAADDPAMTLAGYGKKARAAAGLARLHTIPGKHFPQEDQAPAIARQIAKFVLFQQNVDPRA